MAFSSDSMQVWLKRQERLHPTRIDLGLERVKAVLGRLRLSFGKTRFITVGGTNGKGSSVAFLSAMYRAANYTVGQYTSPHLIDYNERIQINGQPLSDQAICRAFNRIEDARCQTPEISLTYFEFGVLAALSVFAQRQPDVVLLEVGLGGRLDATNAIDADCSIITSISIDHRDWLGSTREEIGFEKAGIYRPGRPAVLGDPDPPESILAHARHIRSDLRRRGPDFDIERESDHWQLKTARQRQRLPYPRHLLASAQLDNAASAAVAVEAMSKYLAVEHEHIAEGIKTACLPGRTQVFRQKPLVILDVAHNQASAHALVETLQRKYSDYPVHAVIGMLQDKEIAATLNELAALRPTWYLAPLASPRSSSALELRAHLNPGHRADTGFQPVKVLSSIVEAYRCAAERVADQNFRGLVLVTGSFFAVAPIMSLHDEAGK